MTKTELLNRCARDADERVLLARALDKLELAQNRGAPAHTDFLSPAEQASLSDLLAAWGHPRHLFFGGFPGAERCICVFLPDWQEAEDWLADPEGPVTALHADFPKDAALTHRCYEVVRFREKPDAATAAEYLASGNFSWNAGMFIWNVAHVRSQLSAHSPELAGFIDRLTAATDLPAFIGSEFPQLTPISIDFALLEKADRVLNFEATFDWDDVGSWISVGKYLPQQEGGNVSNSPMSQVQATNNIVFTDSGKRVALVGVDDLIVVDTGDALLVARRSEADKIKNIVSGLPENLV